MDISRRNRVTDAEEPKGAFRILLEFLWFSINKSSIIHFSQIEAFGFQFKIKIIQRHGAMFHKDLTDSPLFDP